MSWPTKKEICYWIILAIFALFVTFLIKGDINFESYWQHLNMKIFPMAALILSIVNGLILIYYFFSDRPSLVVFPVYPDIYQWWFKLPDGEYEGKKTKKFGFLVYASIANKGKRTTSLSSWKLSMRSKNFLKQELRPISITEPTISLGKLGKKVIGVLGQKGPLFDGQAVIKSGEGVSGFAYYTYEFWGDKSFSPKIVDNKITGYFKIKDIFGSRVGTKIIFSEKTLDHIKEIIPNIDKMETKNNEI